MRKEYWVAVIAGIAAITSAMIAYIAQANVAELRNEFQATHETQLAGLKVQHEKELEILRSELRKLHERQKPFLERQMDHYFEATEAASKIANLGESPERRAATERFWQLYWGPLAVVEDTAVELAMVNFGNALREENAARTRLQQLSLQLAHACRDSLQKLWGTDLGQLKGLRTRESP